MTPKIQINLFFVDIGDSKFKPISDIISKELRPDVVILTDSEMTVLELTACHEMNMLRSRQYKLNKYCNIVNSVKISLESIKVFTIEVSTLGFVSDISRFLSVAKLPKMPKTLLECLSSTALTYSEGH